MSESGQADEYFSIGDERTEMIASEPITLQIYGFNHDELTTGGYAGITFGMKHLMAEKQQMNESDTNSGSFVGSKMYGYLRNTVLQGFPEDARKHVKQVKKKTLGVTNSVSIFLFSGNEVAGVLDNGLLSNDEGYKYPIFTTDASRVKQMANGTGAKQYWWLRSPRVQYGESFGVVSNSGTLSTTVQASFKYGVCFGFCV